MEILNSEGMLMSIEKIQNANYLKIKKHMENKYVYFPITRDQLTSYFAGEISTRQMLTSLDELSFIDELYSNIENSIKENSVDDILRNL